MTFFVKFFPVFILILLQFSTNNVIAQEAKLLKQGEWGSGTYKEMVLLNDLYYVATNEGQIDIFDPSMPTAESLVGQINLDDQIEFLGMHNNRLVILTSHLISIYDVSNITELTLNFYFRFSSSRSSDSYSFKDIAIDEKIYYVGYDNEIYVISENNGAYSLEKEIESVLPKKPSFYIFASDNYFYLFVVYYNSVTSKWITAIEQYKVADNSLVASVVTEGLDSTKKILFDDEERFIIITESAFQVINISNNAINTLGSYPNTQYDYWNRHAYKNNELKVLYRSGKIDSYFIAEDHQIIFQQSTDLQIPVKVSHMKWLDNSLIALSEGYGLIEFEFSNNEFENIKFFYNQTGKFDKGVMQGEYYLLPRENRIDVINVMDKSNIVLHKRLDKSIQKITQHGDKYILESDLSLITGELTDTLDFIYEHEINYSRSRFLYDSIKNEEFFYSLYSAVGNFVSRYDISTPYSIYREPIEIEFPEGQKCPQTLRFINNKLAVYDPCYNGIHLLNNINNDNFEIEQLIKDPSGHATPEIANNLIYYATNNSLAIYSLSDSNQLVQMNSYSMDWENYHSLRLKVVGNYLIAYTLSYVYFFELTSKENPKFLHKFQIPLGKFSFAEFQKSDDTLIAITPSGIQFYQINKAPTASVEQLTIDEDSAPEPILIFTDPESDSMTFSITQAATHGEAIFLELGLVYFPNINFNGEDSVIVKAQDVHGNFIEHEVSITVEPVNDAPTINTSSLTIDEDTLLTTQIEGEDIDGDTLQFTLDENPSHATASLSETGELTIEPDANFNGSDSLTITVTDSHGASFSTVIEITITPVNDSPTLSENNFNTDEDTVLNASLIATDIDGDVLSYTLDSTATSGTLTLQDTGNFSYQPNTNFDGSDSFIVSITDGEITIQETILVEVNPINDAPSITTTTVQAIEDTTFIGQINATDVEGDSLVYAIATLPLSGQATITQTGELTYTPSENFNGSDSIAISVTDSQAASSTSEITIVVSSVNDAPSANHVSFTLIEDETLTELLTATDVDGDSLRFNTSLAPEFGTLSVAEDGSFTYQPELNFDLEDKFEVVVSDSQGGSSTFEVTVTIIPVNDAPTLGVNVFSMVEDSELSSTIIFNDIDSDEHSFEIIETPSHGSVTLNQGQFTYIPEQNYQGIDRFSVKVTDNENLSVEGEVTLQISSINDVPHLLTPAFTLDEDSTLTTTVEVSDIENHEITIEVVDKSAVNGELSINSAGEFTYTPSEDYNGMSSFQIRLRDSEGASAEHNITLTVLPVDDIPVVTVQDFSLSNSTDYSGNLPQQDIDGESLSYNIQTSTTNGTLELSAEGVYSYKPNASFSGTDSFTYTVSDGVNTLTGTVNFTVQAPPPKVIETKETSSGGGSFNLVLMMLLLLTCRYRYQNNNIRVR